MKRIFELWKRTFLFLSRTQKRQLESTTFKESLSSAVKINNRYTSIKLSTRWETTLRVIELNETTCFDLILLIRKSKLQFFLWKYCLNPCNRPGLRHDPRFWNNLRQTYFYVAKETVVLFRRESETWKFDFIKRVEKGRITTVKDLES